MREQPGDPRSLAALREELIALTRRSFETLAEIARIQLRIQELSRRLAKGEPDDGSAASPDGGGEPH
jgi:hypothetical protein